MWRVPVATNGQALEVQHVRKSMCRTTTQFFIHCEVEVPVVARAGGVLGVICWVEVNGDDYERVLAFREHEDGPSGFSNWVSGTLANPVAGVRDSYGTPVRFEVLPHDPTPYVKWVAPATPLAARIQDGASEAFWHQVVGEMGGRRAVD
jgi:hypothetical protein